MRDFIFSRPNDDSRYLQRTALNLSNACFFELFAISRSVAVIISNH